MAKKALIKGTLVMGEGSDGMFVSLTCYNDGNHRDCYVDPKGKIRVRDLNIEAPMEFVCEKFLDEEGNTLWSDEEE